MQVHSNLLEIYMLDSFSFLIGDRPLRVDSKSVKYLAVAQILNLVEVDN
jgi:hypothetical protein